MLTVNAERSGLMGGPGPNKLQVAIEGQNLEEVQASPAKQMAIKVAAEQGFGNGGLCEQPAVGAFHKETGDFLGDDDAFVPGTPVGGYRAEFTFAQRP